MRNKGSKLAIKSKSGAKHAIFIEGFDRSEALSIKIHTREFKQKFRPDVWIALVVIFPGEKELWDYLIPTTVFQNPDEYLFYHHDTSSMSEYYSNVEIKVFTSGIAKLSEYALAHQIKNLE
jgi:hypothetical protein